MTGGVANLGSRGNERGIERNGLGLKSFLLSLRSEAQFDYGHPTAS